jgi:RimJ/RimL family protein N-acetyltransferase/N-acetylglutamate synthase-like GNAT family acetyltransferase
VPDPAYPRRTERLTLRLMRTSDAEVLATYRSDPEVAKLQLWDVPYSVEQAVELLRDQDERDDLALGGWTTLAIEVDGRVVGDVVTNVDQTGGVAEIGYTLAREHQGHGYAREAAGALVADLVERLGVGRVCGELDPTNVPSQRVLESVGMVFEAVTLRSFLWRGEWTDNMSYAATAEQWRAWRDRPRDPVGSVRLVGLDATTQSSYAALRTHHSQERFVPRPLEVYAAAQFAPHPVLLRGVEADGRPAGLVLVRTAADTWTLEALLVDRMLQRRGAGRAAVLAVAAAARDAGASAVVAPHTTGPGSPAPFLRACGFEDRGADPSHLQVGDKSVPRR